MNLLFKNVTKSFPGVTPIQNLSFSLSFGSFFLSGPSGCGKSTLLNLAAGLLKPDSGQVAREGTLSYLFQEDRLLPWFSALQNVALVNQEEAASLLGALGLSGFLQAKPGELSGGMGRRAALARALAKKSDIYLFDEPFTGLDQANKERAAALIGKKTKGALSLFVLHDARDALLLQAEPLLFF